MSDYLPGLLARVTGWLRVETQHVNAIAVAVKAESDEWVGNSYDDVPSALNVQITLNDGSVHEVDNREQQSLWRYVLGVES